MRAIAILKQAQDAGVAIERDGGKLKLKAEGPPAPELLEMLAAHKAEILALLSSPGILAAQPDIVRSRARQAPLPAPNCKFSFASFEENAAILEYDAGLPRDAAEQSAADSILSGWFGEIEALGAIADRDLQRLGDASLAFLVTPHAAAALRSGWDDIDLFGVFDGPLPFTRARLDARGLVPLLAWAPWKLTIQRIGADFAEAITGSGALLRHPRVRPSKHLAAPWWRSFVCSLRESKKGEQAGMHGLHIPEHF